MWTSFVILPWHAAAVVGIYILAFFVSWTKDKTLIMRDASLPGKSKASLTSNRRTWTFFWNDFWSLDKQSAWRQIFVRFSEHYITVHRDAIIVDIVILAWIWKQPRKASHRSMSQEFQLLVPNRKIDKCLWTRLRHCNQTWNVHATIISNLYANAALRYFTSKRLPRRRASDQLNMFYMKLAVDPDCCPGELADTHWRRVVKLQLSPVESSHFSASDFIPVYAGGIIIRCAGLGRQLYMYRIALTRCFNCFNRL